MICPPGLCLMTSRWTAGDQVLLRHIWQGRVWTAMPVTVVEDRLNLVALYLAEGTRRKIPGQRRIPPLQADWALSDHVWEDGYALDLVTPGAAHAATALWAGSGAFTGWHINLQEPLRRTPLGFDTMDHLLDTSSSVPTCPNGYGKTRTSLRWRLPKV